MYQKHKNFKIERTKGLPIWRYMDFWKFLSLLKSSELFFANTTALGDQNEGRVPKEIVKLMYDNNNNKKVESYLFIVNELRPKTLISSWAASHHENFAMWKMYAKEKLGVAVKTTEDRLKSAFKPTKRPVFIGEVNYYNPESPKYEIGNLYLPFLVKHHYYSFENEIRCICSLSDEEFNDGLEYINISVNLNTLIEKIYITDSAKKIGLVDIIQNIKEAKSLDFEIEISGVNDNWL